MGIIQSTRKEQTIGGVAKVQGFRRDIVQTPASIQRYPQPGNHPPSQGRPRRPSGGDGGSSLATGITSGYIHWVLTTNAAKPPTFLPADSPFRRRLPPLLRRSWYGLNQAFRRRIAHTGVTPDQFTALRTLLEGPPEGMTQRDLTTAMSSDPNTVASLVERLVESGWIERRRHERDRRAYRIRALPSGVDRYETVRALALGLQTEILSCLPEADRSLFLEHLEAVSLACRQAAEDAGNPPNSDGETTR